MCDCVHASTPESLAPAAPGRAEPGAAAATPELLQPPESAEEARAQLYFAPASGFRSIKGTRLPHLLISIWANMQCTPAAIIYVGL